MMGTSHMATGAAAWVLVAPMVDGDPLTVAVMMPVAAIAALGPDIDHPSAMLGRMPIIGWAVQKVTTHRVQTHSLLAAAAVWLLFSHVGSVFGLAVAVGWCIGHVAADCLTVEGCALLWPLSSEKIGLHLFKTGGLVETVYCYSLAPIIIGYYAWRLGLWM